MKKQVINQLYYTKKVRYISRNVNVNDDYFFTITLSDSSIYDLASVRNIPIALEDCIIYQKQNSINNSTSVSWNNINDFKKMRIWRSTKLKNNENSFGGGPYSQSAIVETIKPSGSFTIPSSFYTILS